MAAVSQPGSRAGLITALVIFVVLFLVSTVLFFTTNADNKVNEKRYADLKKQYDQVIKPTEMADTEFTNIKAIADEQGNRGRSVFDILRSQRNELSKQITGQPVPTSAALEQATGAIASANKSLEGSGVVVPGASLNNAISVLTQAIVQRQEHIKTLSADFNAAKKKFDDEVATYKKELDGHQAAVAAAEAKSAKNNEETTAYRTSKDEQLSGFEKNLATTVETNRKQLEELNTQLTTRQQEVTDLKKKLEQAYAAMNRFKMTGTAEPSIRRADGAISSVAPNRVVYIDRGLGKQISPGMTFEVYDKNEGIPRLAANASEDSMPAGKASIEVVRVSLGSSEAKVIKQAAGTQIFVGDIIANLIYDPNVKWRFKVYGNFDIDQDGRPTPQEAEIVKRLIAQWGGIVTENLDIDTDFVIMGKEPVVPVVTKAEIEGDAIREFEQKKAEEARVAYEEVKNKALELHIPVLNQNRFLYFIGFFDQAKK